MMTLLVIVWLVLVASLLLHRAVEPVRSTTSWFELKRTKDTASLYREERFAVVVALRRLAELVLVVLITVVSMVLWDGAGVAVVIFVLILSMPIARLKIVTRTAKKIYANLEPRLFKAIDKWPLIAKMTFSVRLPHVEHKIESPEQLLHMLDQSKNILTDEQETIVRSGLQWPTKTVGEIMVQRADIVTVKRSELLGPLVLDDLHKTGYKQFPVIKGSLDNVVGILDIVSSLDVTAVAASQTAEQAMTSRVVHVSMSDSLPQALALLQKSRQHMLIVNDEGGKTVGLLTLADITGSLLGKTGVE